MKRSMEFGKAFEKSSNSKSVIEIYALPRGKDPVLEQHAKRKSIYHLVETFDKALFDTCGYQRQNLIRASFHTIKTFYYDPGIKQMEAVN